MLWGCSAVSSFGTAHLDHSVHQVGGRWDQLPPIALVGFNGGHFPVRLLGWCILIPFSGQALRNVTGVFGMRWIQPGKKKKIIQGTEALGLSLWRSAAVCFSCWDPWPFHRWTRSLSLLGTCVRRTVRVSSQSQCRTWSTSGVTPG